MEKTIVKKGKKIVGFVYKQNDSFWFAFGKPSQRESVSFACKDIEEGIKSINQYSKL